MLISSLFSSKRNNQNYEVWFHLARSTEIFEYLETVINGKRTGKTKPNCLKIGKILGFHVQFYSFPLFWKVYFLPTTTLALDWRSITLKLCYSSSNAPRPFYLTHFNTYIFSLGPKHDKCKHRPRRYKSINMKYAVILYRRPKSKYEKRNSVKWVKSHAL